MKDNTSIRIYYYYDFTDTDHFCSMLEDFAHIENVYKIADISGVDENLFSENLLGRFDRVIKN